VQSYTFASDDAMAAVLAAFDASGDDTYAVSLCATDVAALVGALDAYVLSSAEDWSRAHAAHVRRAAAGRDRYEAQWTRELFAAVISALRAYWEATPDGDYDGSTHDNAGSLLSGIAETLGVEFV